MFAVLKRLLFGTSLTWAAFLFAGASPAQADNARCAVPQSIINELHTDFVNATNTVTTGLFNPKLMWGAVVDRQGVLCAPLFKTGDAWPGSRAIAIAKAETANDFSNDKYSLSTANLYALSIPQGSLYGLNNSNTFNAVADDPRIPAQGFVPGGIITFGGGVPLYAGTTVIGGFGVSGDTSCSDHDVAYTARQAAINDGVLHAPPNNDNIIYPAVAGAPVTPNTFQHPFCLNSGPPPSGHSRGLIGHPMSLIR